LISKGKIPSFKIGSEWRFRKDVIMRWFDEKSMRAQLLRKSSSQTPMEEFDVGR
jgi:hypothetical protein